MHASQLLGHLAGCACHQPHLACQARSHADTDAAKAAHPDSPQHRVMRTGILGSNKTHPELAVVHHVQRHLLGLDLGAVHAILPVQKLHDVARSIAYCAVVPASFKRISLNPDQLGS